MFALLFLARDVRRPDDIIPRGWTPSTSTWIPNDVRSTLRRTCRWTLSSSASYSRRHKRWTSLRREWHSQQAKIWYSRMVMKNGNYEKWIIVFLLVLWINHTNNGRAKIQEEKNRKEKQAEENGKSIEAVCFRSGSGCCWLLFAGSWFRTAHTQSGWQHGHDANAIHISSLCRQRASCE